MSAKEREREREREMERQRQGQRKRSWGHPHRPEPPVKWSIKCRRNAEETVTRRREKPEVAVHALRVLVEHCLDLPDQVAVGQHHLPWPRGWEGVRVGGE